MGAMSRGRALALLLLLGAVNEGPLCAGLWRVSAQNNTSGNDSNGSSFNPYIQCCSTTMRYEARLACKEFEFFSLGDKECAFWQDYAETDCINSRGNCTRVAMTIYSQCLFFLGRILSFSMAQQYCLGAQGAFELGRCPSACQADRHEHCFSEEAVECNALCGNWHENCDCTRERGTFGAPDTCFGETVLQGVIPGSMGLEHSCTLMPQECKNHWPGTDCGKYRHCDVDLCVVRNVSCPLRDSCDKEGFCDPSDGGCYYVKQPEGANCEDGLNYTWGDICTNGICIGVEDKCSRYGINCTTSNPCLEPQMRPMWFGESSCDTTTGACMFDMQPDGTVCETDVGRGAEVATFAGACLKGVCRRYVTDLCYGVKCAREDRCNEAGLCNHLTGECVTRHKAEGTLCDDGNRATWGDRCIEGRCFGDPIMRPLFQELGMGSCSHHQQMVACPDSTCDYMESPPPMVRYYGYLWDIRLCERQCGQDPGCLAYDYGYQVCSIYGGNRTLNPSSAFWGNHWILEPELPLVTYEVLCFRKEKSDVYNIPPRIYGSLLGVSVAIVIIVPSTWVIIQYWTFFKGVVNTIFFDGPNPLQDSGDFDFSEEEGDNDLQAEDWPKSPGGFGAISPSPKALEGHADPNFAIEESASDPRGEVRD